jgi:nucleotide-binding universal stress UspA family protein
LATGKLVSDDGYRIWPPYRRNAGSSGRQAGVGVQWYGAKGPDLVRKATRGYGTIPGLLLGSVTLRLLHTADCPVLAVPVIVATAKTPHVDPAPPS